MLSEGGRGLEDRSDDTESVDGVGLSETSVSVAAGSGEGGKRVLSPPDTMVPPTWDVETMMNVLLRCIRIVRAMYFELHAIIRRVP